jgi:antitoxin PrlF
VRHWETSKLSSKGQVTLPSEVRKAIGAKSGDTIAYEIEGNMVRLKRAESVDAEFHSALTDTLDEWSSNADEEAFRDL